MVVTKGANFWGGGEQGSLIKRGKVEKVRGKGKTKDLKSAPSPSIPPVSAFDTYSWYWFTLLIGIALPLTDPSPKGSTKTLAQREARTPLLYFTVVGTTTLSFNFTDCGPRNCTLRSSSVVRWCEWGAT